MDSSTPSNELTEEQLLLEISRLARLGALEIVGSSRADDVSQDVVLECLANMRSGQLVIDPESLPALVRQMARRRAIDCLRGNRRRDERGAEYLRETAESTRAWMSPDLDLDAEELAAFHERTLKRLPRTCRHVFVMVREERTAYKIVARRLGLSRGVVCAHVVTAQREFRVGLLQRGIAIPPTSRRSAPPRERPRGAA